MLDDMQREFDRLVADFHQARDEMYANFGDPNALERFHRVIAELNNFHVRLKERLRQESD